ncbi:hypothetical protein Scep_003741 [Stephania cephalantha]|uniref:Uncharacterized protein n=1 Tax=Stephania cephalantha TaxID=152367 RepID=A0AAP0KR32_9MAGN
MGTRARKTLEHALGTMPMQDPRTHGPSHPEPVGLDRAPANTQGAWAQPGTTEQSQSLRETWATSLEAWMDQVKAVLGGWPPIRRSRHPRRRASTLSSSSSHSSCLYFVVLSDPSPSSSLVVILAPPPWSSCISPTPHPRASLPWSSSRRRSPLRLCSPSRPVGQRLTLALSAPRSASSPVVLSPTPRPRASAPSVGASAPGRRLAPGRRAPQSSSRRRLTLALSFPALGKTTDRFREGLSGRAVKGNTAVEWIFACRQDGGVRLRGNMWKVISHRGGMGTGARKTLEHALGTMPRQDPRTHGPSHPEPVGLDRAPANTQGAWAQPGTTEQSQSLRETWATSLEAWMDQVKAVLGGWVTTLVMAIGMTKARPRMSRIHGACAN